MSSLDNIQELDDFYEFKQYIKQFILESEDLFRIIYFPVSNPFDDKIYPYPENPYQIFISNTNNDSKNVHGVVLFNQKDNEILNYETPIILINFTSETSQDSDSINYTKIEFSIICKGINIQELENGKSRSYAIAELIDKSLNHVRIKNSGEVKRQYLNQLTLNEENIGFKLCYTSQTSNYNDIVKVYTHNETVDEWGITRQSYSLCTTITNPIIYPMENLYSQLSDGTYESLATEPNAETLVDVIPYSLDKNKKDYGYDVIIKRRLICNIVPEINESTIIGYEDKYYRVEKFINYEDYMDCTLVVTWNAIINE